MEANFFDSKRKLQFNKSITILTIVSLVSLVLMVIGDLSFTAYRGVYRILTFTDDLIEGAPVIIFAIYIFKFYKQFKADVSIPILLGIIAFKPIYWFIRGSIFFYDFLSIFNVLLGVVTAISFVLATISSLKGFPKKIYIIIAVGCGVLNELVSLISFIDSIIGYIDTIYIAIINCIEDGEYHYWFNLFTTKLNIIGCIALYIALLLFCLNNKIMSPVAIRVKKEKNTEKMTPEQLLKCLKEELELGVISEEEYQTRRADIISKL